MLALFLLPAELWRDNILAFFSLKDMSRAFEAFSNHHLQRTFQELTFGHTTKSILILLQAGKAEKLKWCLARNILPGDVNIWNDMDWQIASLSSEICARATKLSFFFVAQISQPIRCARLRSLYLLKCNIRSLENLLVFPNLAELYLDECSEITIEKLLEQLAECTQLERCTIDNCELIHDKAISFILNHCTRLKSLNLRAARLQRFNLSSIFAACNHPKKISLRSLALRDCTVSSAGWRQLAIYAPLLQSFQLSGSGSDIYNADVEFMVQQCSHFTDLALDSCNYLDNAAIDTIVRYLPRLEQFRMSSCGAVDDDGVVALAKGCLQLTKLDISFCNSVTNAAVQQVLLNCVLLVTLNVSGCQQITDAAFDGRTTTVLRELDVSSTKVTGSFLRQTPLLSTLYCNDCSLLNSELVQILTTTRHALKMLSLNKTRLSAADFLILSLHLPLAENVGVGESEANDEVITSLVANCPRLFWIYAKGCAAVSSAKVRELELAQARKLCITM